MPPTMPMKSFQMFFGEPALHNGVAERITRHTLSDIHNPLSNASPTLSIENELTTLIGTTPFKSREIVYFLDKRYTVQSVGSEVRSPYTAKATSSVFDALDLDTEVFEKLVGSPGMQEIIDSEIDKELGGILPQLPDLIPKLPVPIPVPIPPVNTYYNRFKELGKFILVGDGTTKLITDISDTFYPGLVFEGGYNTKFGLSPMIYMKYSDLPSDIVGVRVRSDFIYPDTNNQGKIPPQCTFLGSRHYKTSLALPDTTAGLLSPILEYIYFETDITNEYHPVDNPFILGQDSESGIHYLVFYYDEAYSPRDIREVRTIEFF